MSNRTKNKDFKTGSQRVLEGMRIRGEFFEAKLKILINALQPEDVDRQN